MKKQLIIILSGTAFAQLIPILVSPILTRLFSPEEFGIFALFSAVIGIAGIFASMRLELSIAIPSSNHQALRLVSVIQTLALFLTLASFLILVLYQGGFNLEVPRLAEYSYFIPVLVFLFAVTQAYYYLANRYGFFKLMAISKVMRTGLTSSLQVLFGVLNLGALGLIAGFGIGLLGLFIYLSYFLRLKINIAKPSLIKSSLIRFKNFPALMMPSSLIEALSVHMPLFLLAYFYDPSIAGLYALTQRIIQVPISVLCISVSDVLRKQVSVLFQRGDTARPLIIKAATALSVVSGVVSLGMFLLSEWLFGLVFGSDWAESGLYVEYAIGMIFLRVIANPIGIIFVLAEKQNYDFLIQAFSLVLGVVGLYLGYLLHGRPEMSILYFSFAYMLKFLIEIALSVYFSGNHKTFSERRL